MQDLAAAGIGGRDEGRNRKYQQQPRAALGARERVSNGEERPDSPQAAADLPG